MSRDQTTLGSSRGVALISVLWVTSLLAVLAASFASSSRTEARLARNGMENAKAEALADGAVHRAILALLDHNPQTAWRVNGVVYAFVLGEGEVQVTIEDEDGKLDLNEAPLELLAGLFRALGVEAEQAQVLADRIGDFRDRDGEPEPLGAEDPAYLNAGLVLGAADRPFASESELLHVLGMSPGLYERVRPYVTVYSGRGGIDPMRAARPVLEALPGSTPEVVKMLLTAAPDADPLLAIDEDVLLDLKVHLLLSRESVFTIRALSRTTGGGMFLREAVAELNAGQEPPFLIHAWRRGVLASAPG